MQQQETPHSAASNFWVLDKDGLITQERSNLPDYVSRFAQPVAPGAGEGASLLEVIKAVKPTVLLGLAGAPVLLPVVRLRAGSTASSASKCYRP